jgi:oligoribonuclease
MPKKDIIHLLWIDLETTGLETLGGGDEIIEIGCILTTEDLRVLGEFEAVVKPSDSAMARLAANQFVVDMHTANGLLDAISRGLSIAQAELSVLRWLRSLGVSVKMFDSDPGALQKLTLAGSGVGHFDLPTIREHMPKLAERLNYYVIDVGTIRRAHDMWVGTPVSAANDAKTHRAIDDVRCHLEEAKAFAELWRGPRSDGSETQAVIIASRSAAPPKPCSDWVTLACQ